MPKLMELSGRYSANDRPVTFSVEFEMPERDASGDYVCRLVSPELFANGSMQVVGVTPKQAVRLALECVKANLEYAVGRAFSDEMPEDRESA